VKTAREENGGATRLGLPRAGVGEEADAESCTKGEGGTWGRHDWDLA